MNIHFIAIGGAAMHNLALALHQNGDIVTGSDDEIYEPSKSRLTKYGLLPEAYGWYPDKVNENIDAIILGMHAKIDNPELLKAQELDLKIYSYPSFIAEQSKNKKRVVIAGSHGKTTTTSIIMHVLKDNNINFDYLVGSIIEGFDTMVKLSDAPIIVLEGDEYLSSPLDHTPKMLHYHPHISVITGIAWDHINVFPTFENYKLQFQKFIDIHEPDAKIFYYENDEHLAKMTSQEVHMIPYNSIKANEKHEIKIGEETFQINLIGNHNYQNIKAAQLVCNDLGIDEKSFFKSLSTFPGAKKRLQLMHNDLKNNTKIYLDFAHSPSKVKATVEAVRAWYPHHKLITFFELHTYSSFQSDFITHYKNTLNGADKAYILYNQKTLQIKNITPPDDEHILASFNQVGATILKDKDEVSEHFDLSKASNNCIILIMTSGNFFNLKI